MALDEVNINGGVLWWKALLLCRMVYRYDVEARIIWKAMEKIIEWCDWDVVTASEAL